MGDLKIVGPDGRPMAPPSKHNPNALREAAAALKQPMTIATIDLFPDGRAGLKHIAPLPLVDYAYILSELTSSLIGSIKLELEKKAGLVPPGDPPAPDGEGVPG